MTFKILLSFFLIFLLSACATTSPHTTDISKTHDTWFGEDKLYHFLTASVIGAAATKIAVNNQASPCDAMIIGISSTLVIGAGKEWYDLKVKKTLFSWKDMFWNLAGSSVGSFAVSECR